MRSAMIGCLIFVGATVNAQETNQPLTVAIYPVADLVVEPAASRFTEQLMLTELGGSIESLKALSGDSDADAAITKHLEELTELIQGMTAPDMWAEVGGRGRIATHRKTLTLVVRQTKDVHAEITELLQQLRAENNLKVELTIEVLQESQATQPCPAPCLQPLPQAVYQSVPQPAYPAVTPAPPQAVAPPNLYSPAQPAQPAQPAPSASPQPLVPVNAQIVAPAAGSVSAVPAAIPPKPKKELKDVIAEQIKKFGKTLDAEELSQFRAAVGESAKQEHSMTSLFSNGQRQFMLAFDAVPVVSGDRRVIDVHLNHPILATMSGSVQIPEGKSAVVSMRSDEGDGNSFYLIVTAKLQVMEEEEELIPKQRTSGTAPSR